MDIYEVTIVGTFKTITVQVLAYGIWGAWEHYDEVMSGNDYPRGIGRTIEINLKYLKPNSIGA